MKFSEMELAVREAEAELRRVDLIATSLARMLKHRLRRVEDYTALVALKKELRKFNIQTLRWTQ